MDKYLIGDILLTWDCDGYNLMQGTFMDRFRYEGDWKGENICFRGHVEPLAPYTDYPCVERNRIYDRYDVCGEPLMVYHWGYLRNGFAIWPQRAGKIDTMCMFDPALLDQHPVSGDWFFGVSGLHAALLHRDALILHASYIDYQGKAILFTAPSQTGKSTQAALWQRYAAAQIINGDRVLLRKKGEMWNAYGFPCCGSSNICVDRTLPVAAIVVLEQGSDNVITPISPSQMVRALVSGTELHFWDTEQIGKAFDIAGQIAGQVPIIKLACTPDENAVKALRKFLEEAENGKCV